MKNPKLWQKIQKLDLELVKDRCRISAHGYGWSKEKCEQIELLYKRFLYMSHTSKESTVPSFEVDCIWHMHILDTMKYHKDCNELFGEYFHHYDILPNNATSYPSSSSKLGAKKLKNMFDQSQVLETKAFGETSFECDKTPGPCLDPKQLTQENA